MKNNRHNRNRVKMLFKSLGLPHKHAPSTNSNFHLTTFPKMRYSLTWWNNYLLGKGHLNVALFHKYHRNDPTYKYFYK